MAKSGNLQTIQENHAIKTNMGAGQNFVAIASVTRRDVKRRTTCGQPLPMIQAAITEPMPTYTMRRYQEEHTLIQLSMSMWMIQR